MGIERNILLGSIRTASFILLLSCSTHEQSVQPVSNTIVPPAGETMARPTIPECWNAIGGTCCDIRGDTSITIGSSIAYKYIHSRTKIDSIGWELVNGDPTSVTIQANDSIAVVTFLPNFSSGTLRAYAKGVGWACQDILNIRK
jgi:hypothetical protein